MRGFSIPRSFSFLKCRYSLPCGFAPRMQRMFLRSLFCFQSGTGMRFNPEGGGGIAFYTRRPITSTVDPPVLSRAETSLLPRQRRAWTVVYLNIDFDCPTTSVPHLDAIFWVPLHRILSEYFRPRSCNFLQNFMNRNAVSRAPFSRLPGVAVW